MKKSKSPIVAKIALLVILFAIIVLPIIRMFFYIDKQAIVNVFSSKTFGKAVGNSLLASFVATVISVVLAYLLAWNLNRTNIKLKGVFAIILVLPMLIPSISHGMGLIVLFGNNGVITRALSGLGATGNIYGFKGVVLGSVLYSFPVAYLMLADVFKYEDYSPYEAAEVLGISKSRQFSAITLPYIKKPLISVVFAVFTMIITDYGVPLSVGGQFKTLPVMLYEEAVGQLNYSNSSVIGVLLIIPAVIAFLIDLFNNDKGNLNFISRDFEIKKNVLRDVLGYIVCGVVALFTLMVILSFCIQAFAKSYPQNMAFTFANFAKTFKKNGAEFLGNSIIMSLATAIVGTVVTFTVAYFTSRMRSKLTRFLHLISITSLAIPGLVLGLSYVIVFKKSFVYGTIIILIMVNLVHFFSSPYLLAYNAFGKINENLESAGNVLGISRLRIVKDVIIPQTKYTILEMLSYFFVNCMMTISAVSFLATSENKPLSLLINQFESYNMMECAAVVALLILAVNMTVKITIGLIKRLGAK